MNVGNFFSELKRRNVYKVGITYIVAAWLLIQAASILLPTFDAPTWLMKAFVAFLAVYREGAETALFYQALFNEGSHVVLPISLGIVTGFTCLAVIFTLFSHSLPLGGSQPAVL